MNDLSTGKIFKSSAFEPSDEELTKAARSRRQRRIGPKRETSTFDEDIEIDTPPPKKFTGSSLDLNDSSDDDMPDLQDLLAGRDGKEKLKKKIQKKTKQTKPDRNSDLVEDVSVLHYFLLVVHILNTVLQDDIIDLTIDDISVQLSTLSSSKFNKTRHQSASESPAPKCISAKAKGKHKALTHDSDEESEDANEANVGTGKMPSDAVFATWRKGDDDLEPSTKMLGLINLLNEWDCTGDKTICYSQCKLPLGFACPTFSYPNGLFAGTSMLDLVEKLFSRYGIRSLRYDGSMDRNSRDAALATFKKAGGPKVILIRYVSFMRCYYFRTLVHIL